LISAYAFIEKDSSRDNNMILFSWKKKGVIRDAQMLKSGMFDLSRLWA
jgi:hypothetical protein